MCYHKRKADVNLLSFYDRVNLIISDGEDNSEARCPNASERYCLGGLFYIKLHLNKLYSNFLYIETLCTPGKNPIL